VGLVSVNNRGVEIVSFLFLFIIHASFSVYLVSEMNVFILTFGDSLLLQLSLLAIIVTLVLHFISLIFILMMIYAQERKFAGTKGTPLYLPDKYAKELTSFKKTMIGCFTLCSILLFIIFQKNNDVTQYHIKGILELFKSNGEDNRIKKLYYVLSFVISPILIGLSINQIIIANDFTNLARKKLQT
jgi:hypothetical protein